MAHALVMQALSFSYDSANSALFSDLDLHLPQGWTGIVGANGAGKTTLLKLAAGLLTPSAGTVTRPNRSIYCAQRTDDPPADLGSLLACDSGEAGRLRSLMGVGPDWLHRWSTLSHGERKRAQLAVALWREPDLLAVDEPTNHLDAEAREMLHRGLAAFRGVGVLVSHDRDLLDGLCTRCLFLDPPRATLRPGTHTAGAREAERERLEQVRQFVQTRSRAEKLRREVVRRREEASRANKKRSKRHLDRHDSDGREKIDRARVTGKDGQAGRLKRQLEGRLGRLEAQATAVSAPSTRKLRFWLAGSSCRGDALAHLEEGRLSLGPTQQLSYPRILLRPRDRVALVGPNGSGKSTLLDLLVYSAQIPPERIVYLRQEVPAREAAELLSRVRSLPRPHLGHLMAAVAGLGSDARRLLATDLPTPGETRKLLLALGVVSDPWLIVMDEPSNHLDLPSIELLERALSECPCALLLASHDRRLVQRTGCRRWVVRAEGPGKWALAAD